MASPTNQSTTQLTIPPGESLVQYSASFMAQRILNLERTPEDTLSSVLGPTQYDTAPWDTGFLVPGSSYTETVPHSVFHTTLEAGSAQMLIVRFGSKLKRYMGGGSTSSLRPWVTLVEELADDGRPRFPDQYVTLNNKIIWTNGLDRARVITYDNMVTPLGYSQKPSAPTALGPTPVYFSETPRHMPNTLGYSWPGEIGTPGDSLDGRTGALLNGSWYYYLQYEDVHGNLSPFSLASNAAQVFTAQADPFDPFAEKIGVATEIDSLTRAFLVQIGGDGPEHTVAMHIYRTPDTKRASTIPQLMERIPGASEFVYGDKKSDTALGSQWTEYVAVPTFKVMCTHQGSLVIGNTGAEPGIVRKSEPGFPGTFPLNLFVFPDSGGSEVTGLVSHGGMLLAFTETSVYSLQDFGAPVPIAKGVGCVAPATIHALPDGTLVWLGRDGFYAMRGTAITHISQPIQREMRHYLNRAMLRRATASVDAVTGEYRCALAPAGSDYNELMLVFDGTNWRRQELGYHIADICQTDDWRQYNLFVGRVADRTEEFSSNLYVMGRERPDDKVPARKVRYRSAWIRGDDTALTPLNIRSLYLGMVDAWDGDATIRFYKNGSWDPVLEMNDLRLVGVDNESNVVTDIAGSAVLGTAKAHHPRLYWRQVPVDLRNVNTWAFEIEVSHPNRLHLASIAFDMSVATMGNPRGRIPLRADK